MFHAIFGFVYFNKDIKGRIIGSIYFTCNLLYYAIRKKSLNISGNLFILHTKIVIYN